MTRGGRHEDRGQKTEGDKIRGWGDGEKKRERQTKKSIG
jgi:hypothetical protein